MAKANPAKLDAAPVEEKKENPVVEYIGEGADKVKFNVDPRAKRIRVYGSGVVLVDY